MSHSVARITCAPAVSGSLAIDVSARNRLGDVSRPEALAAGPQEIVLGANGKPRQGVSSTLSYASHKPMAKPAPAAAREPAAQTGGEGRSVFGRMLGLFGG